MEHNTLIGVDILTMDTFYTSRKRVQSVLAAVSTGLHETFTIRVLIVTHAPMHTDVVPGPHYHNIQKVDVRTR